ncbi:hypothetical protein EI94DRAFT_482964 [Lactarius quietus]|nr:hypothetical protein EI94DRAFT_482964 [Lactarius quietus]
MHTLHIATPVPVPLFPTPTIISLSVSGSSAPLLPSSRPFLVAAERISSPPALLSNAPSTQFAQPPGSFSRPSTDVRALRRCCHPQEQPQTGAVFVEIPYLPLTNLYCKHHGSSRMVLRESWDSVSSSNPPVPRSGPLSHNPGCDRWGSRCPRSHRNNKLGKRIHSGACARYTVKRERFLASRAPNPSIVPGEVRSNCSQQRLTFSSSRRDAFLL